MTATAIRPLADVEREAILHAIEALNGDTALAAKALGISRNTIYGRLRHYGVRIRRQRAICKATIEPRDAHGG